MDSWRRDEARQWLFSLWLYGQLHRFSTADQSCPRVDAVAWRPSRDRLGTSSSAASVQVHNGVVTLTGTVTGWAKRVAAQEAAQRVIGVLDVANDIKVNVPGTRTHTDIARASQHEDAERAVRNLFGVEGISNTITLNVATPVTGDVRKAIEQALERRAEREARRIRVDVHDGVVTLTGTVHTWAERKSVLAAARFTPGVRSVDDRLRIEPV